MSRLDGTRHRAATKGETRSRDDKRCRKKTERRRKQGGCEAALDCRGLRAFTGQSRGLVFHPISPFGRTGIRREASSALSPRTSGSAGHVLCFGIVVWIVWWFVKYSDEPVCDRKPPSPRSESLQSPPPVILLQQVITATWSCCRMIG